MMKIKYDRFQPCEHKWCLSHMSHPCEGCGRIGGDGVIYQESQSLNYRTRKMNRELIKKSLDSLIQYQRYITGEMASRQNTLKLRVSLANVIEYCQEQLKESNQ